MAAPTSFRTLLLVLVALFCTGTVMSAAVREKRSAIEVDNPEETLRVLASLAQRIMESESFQSEKRGLDLGLSRGFSGSQAAKHLMGLSAASFANGPGRRRRNV